MRHLLRVAIFAVTALIAACGQRESPSDIRVVKLGFAAPLTGPQAHYGLEMRKGVILALDDINASVPKIGGHPIRFELLSEDDQADPRQGTAVAQKLVDAGIAGMLGHFNSGTSIPASKIYAEAGIPQLAMATSAAYTAQGYKTTFRMMTSDTQQGSVLGRYAVQTLGARRIAVIDDRTAYGQGLADQFEQAVRAAGGEIVRREYSDDRATDFSAILTAIKPLKPDLVFFGGADVQAAPLLRQLRSLGLSAKFAGGEMLKSPDFLALAGDAAEGTYASLPGVPLLKMPGGAAYASRYRARFGTEVETYSPYAYDAAIALMRAMLRADTTEGAQVLRELAATRERGVTTEQLAYDEHGNLADGRITVWRVEHGAWTAMESAGN